MQWTVSEGSENQRTSLYPVVNKLVLRLDTIDLSSIMFPIYN